MGKMYNYIATVHVILEWAEDSCSLWCSSFTKKSKDGITSNSEGGIFRGHWRFAF